MIREISFQGQWTSQNCHLQSNLSAIFKSHYLSTWGKIHLIFNRSIEFLTRFFCPPLLLFARSIIVLSSILPEHTVSKVKQDWIEKWDGQSTTGSSLRDAYEPIRLKLKTPDNIHVNAFFYRHKKSSLQDIPTILCFNGNGELAQGPGWDWMLNMGKDSPQPFNVLVYDYTTLDLKSSRDLILYGETLFQAARGVLGISEHNLHFFGFSLGGAISAFVAQLHPHAGRVVNLNSFASLKNMTTHSTVLKKIPQCFRWVMAQVTHAIGWSIEPAEALRSLKRKTLFVYNPCDKLIPPSLTAVTALAQRPNFIASNAAYCPDDANVLVLKPNRNITICDENYSHHNAPLSRYEDAHAHNASDRVLSFLLGRGFY